MQIHSHLLQNEIIGFVAGYLFGQEKKKYHTLVITEIYPGSSHKFDDEENLSDDQKDPEKNVEFSPESW